MNYTNNIKKTSYRAIVGLVLVFIMLFGIGFGGLNILGPKTALATENFENDYVRFEKFYYDPTDNLIVEFFCKTTFNATNPWDKIYIRSIGGYNWYVKNMSHDYDNTTLGIQPNLINDQYIAGNTYKLYLKYFKNFDVNDYTYYYLTKATWEAIKGSNMNSTDSIQAGMLYNIGVPTDTILAYFSETPTLNITFPFQNAEISEAFNIQGSYTIPENSSFQGLIAFFYTNNLPYASYSFRQNFEYTSDPVDIRVSGLASKDYRIEFWFVGSGVEAYHATGNDINISIVSSIPPELPGTQETPPEFYDSIDADQFYLDNSNYNTPTQLYINLKNATGPIFTTIGSNLAFFASKFDQDMAQQTGEKTGQAILLARSYSTNLNTFFNDLPVSEFLLFYLTLLIAVMVFRITRNLINLIKP